jgi:hypothetical protein
MLRPDAAAVGCNLRPDPDTNRGMSEIDQGADWFRTTYAQHYPSVVRYGLRRLVGGTTAEHRAALLRFLATTDGLHCAGTAQDPAGRTGTMVGYSAPPEVAGAWEDLLLFDPGTGELLDSGGRDGAGPPSWHTQWLERGRTDTLG